MNVPARHPGSTVRLSYEEKQRLNEFARASDMPAKRVVHAVLRRLGVAPEDNAVDRRKQLPALLAQIIKSVDGAMLEEIRTFLDGGDAEIDERLRSNLGLIQRAQRLFDDHGVAILTALFHASLPEAYLGQRGVQALDATGELYLNWTHRVQETGQFLVNVLSPTPDLWQRQRSSLTSGEFGARATRRVRLTHAAIRWMLEEPAKVGLSSLRQSDDGGTAWDARLRAAGLENCIGQPPLNQQDLLATLGTFTTVVFGALERLGVAHDEEDREAFHFLWNIVGWHLGIGDEESLTDEGIDVRQEWTNNGQLPMSADEMDATYRYLAAELQHPSDAGNRMAKALIQELAYPLPRPLQGAPAFVARYLIGNAHANDLCIEEGGYFELFLAQSGILERWTKRARTGAVGRLSFGLLSTRVTRYALRAFITQARWSERGLTIDPRIAAKWGIHIPPEPRAAALEGPARHVPLA